VRWRRKFKARHVYSDEQRATRTPSLLAAANSICKLEYNCGLWLQAAVTAGSFVKKACQAAVRCAFQLEKYGL
jgi:hypothetical protein